MRIKLMSLVASLLLSISLIDTAYAKNDYKLNYGDKINYTNVSTSELEKGEGVGLLQFTEYYNSKVSERFGNKPYSGKHFRYDLDIKEINKRSEYKPSSANKVNDILEMTGLIGIPSQPVSKDIFIFMHGRLGKVHNSEYGFSYLVDYMASNGYYAISLDDYNMYYSDAFEDDLFRGAVLKLVKSLESGKTTDINTGKQIKIKGIDKIHLIGHSRAGYFVFKVADELIDNNYKVANIVSIAPVNIREFKDSDLHDIPVKIILPEFDGDVITLEGEDIYNSLVSKQYNSSIDMMYIFGANHNYFNTAMLADDSKGITEQRDELYELIIREDHMNILIDTMEDLVGSDEEAEIEIGIENEDTNIPIPGDIIHREYNNTYKSVLNYCTDTTVDVSNADRFDLESSEKYNIDYYSAFRAPGENQYTYKAYYKMRELSSVTYDIPNSNTNEVVVELALDSSTFDMSLDTNTTIQLCIIDIDGNILVKDYDLTLVIGYCEKIGENQKRYSTYTPFEQIKLSIPNEIMIDKIALVTPTSTFDIVIKEIYINK